MSQTPQYPLEQLITIKQNRFDQAVKTLEAKKELLEKAYEKLFDLTQEQNEVQEHKTAKLIQVREELDKGTTTDKIQQMKAYLKVVDEKLAEKKKKVAAQQKTVDTAQKQVDLATDDLFQKKKDLEKLEMHKKEWQKEMGYWVEQKEAAEHDEQGAATYHILKQAEKKRKQKKEEKDATEGSL